MRFLGILVRNLSIVALLLAIGYAGMATQKFERFETVLPKGSPALVIQKCETATPGVFPKGVVLQRTGGGAYISRNPQAIDRALDTALDGADWPEMQVIKFCK